MTATASELHRDVQRILAADDAELEHAIARLDRLRALAQIRRRLAEMDSTYQCERRVLEQRLANYTAELEHFETGRAPS